MITIEELLSLDARLRRFAAQPEMDPLTENDALQEAQLLDVRVDALRSTVGLLFELRVALQLREANTGALVAHGVRKISWSSSPRPTPRTAWNVMSPTPRCSAGGGSASGPAVPDAACQGPPVTGRMSSVEDIASALRGYQEGLTVDLEEIFETLGSQGVTAIIKIDGDRSREDGVWTFVASGGPLAEDGPVRVDSSSLKKSLHDGLRLLKARQAKWNWLDDALGY